MRHSTAEVREPEVLVSPTQRIALEQLAAALRDGRLTTETVAAANQPIVQESVIVPSMVIAPFKADVLPAIGTNVPVGTGGGAIRQIRARCRGGRIVCQVTHFRKGVHRDQDDRIQEIGKRGAGDGSGVRYGRDRQEGPPVSPQPTSSQAKSEKPLIPLRVQVTLSRSEGDKKTSSLPFTLWVSANGDQTSLNVGSRVPTPTSVVAGGAIAESYTYQNVGTSLTSSATSLDDGRFNVSLTISDSSLMPAAKAAGSNLPTFQSFTASNKLLLRDGQTAQFIAATDKVTGEVTRVEMTIAVIK